METKNIKLMMSETLSHYNADQVVQGDYWNKMSKRGCFIGCLTHSYDPAGVTDKFGLELPLVKLLESIFERLPESEAKEFFKDIPVAIGSDGRDLSLVKWAFLRDTLKSLPEQGKAAHEVIDPVIVGMDLLASGKDWDAVNAADAAYNVHSYDDEDSAAYAAFAAATCAEKRNVPDEAVEVVESAETAAIRSSPVITRESAERDGVSECRRQAASLLTLIKAA